MGKDNRSHERIRFHYEVEKELASRLSHASAAERLKLYPLVYRELFQRVTDHPMLIRKDDPISRDQYIEEQIDLLRPFLKPDTTFVEIGPGDCTLLFEVSKVVQSTYGIDVVENLTSGTGAPPNFKLLLTDGIKIDIPSGSADIAYSNQLMEHLHPDDAFEQLKEIHRVLKPGGLYFCITPHRFMGPDDVSMYFDEVATCFHLKEYIYREIRELFALAGFRKLRSYAGIKGKYYFKIPLLPAVLLEFLLDPMPYKIRKKMATSPIIRNFLYIKVLAMA
jgi:SAM-dependent methyltransferase